MFWLLRRRRGGVTGLAYRHRTRIHRRRRCLAEQRADVDGQFERFVLLVNAFQLFSA